MTRERASGLEDTFGPKAQQFSRFAITQADTALASSLRLAWAMQISAPYSFLLSSNFGRLGVAMDLRSMIANVQAEPKVSVAIGYFVTR